MLDVRRFLLLGKPHVFARVHLEIQHQRILRVRLDHFLHEFHVDRVFAEDGIFVHRLEIDGNEEWPVDFRVDSLAAFDAQDFRDFEELHPRVHHHLLHAGGGDLLLQVVENDMVNHEGKANRRFQRGAQAQSALSKAPTVAAARETPKPRLH
jgi:hypothetical protein